MDVSSSLVLLPILLLATPSLIPPLHTHIALRGRPSYLSILNLCLGLQTPLNPRVLNDGEYPACAAMTTGVSKPACKLPAQLAWRIKKGVMQDAGMSVYGNPVHPILCSASDSDVV